MDPRTLVHGDHLGPALVELTGDARWRQPAMRLVSGGKSNLTILLTSDAGELILRRPPTGDLLPSAHDMMREARIQRALADTDVPVPAILLADPGELIGVPCYVMTRAPGHTIRDELPDGYATTPAERRAMTEVFIDTLARLHAVDAPQVGLADYGRPEGYMQRQLRRWSGQWEKTKIHEVPEIDELATRLSEVVPPQRRSTITHGDYRFDNVLFDTGEPGRINAVLDWELSTLGDPLSDLGLLMLFWREPGEHELPLIPGVTHLDGFPSRREVLERYAETAGVDLSDMGFYQAFAHFKFAVIAQGVQSRSRAGSMGGQDFGNLDAGIARLAKDGLTYL